LGGTAALNALNAGEVAKMVDSFATGSLLIINEALLIYLNENKKIQLCKSLHSTLQQSRGYLITTDAYMKRNETMQDS
jgi:chemotaxis methyl-accepting protein methylase